MIKMLAQLFSKMAALVFVTLLLLSILMSMVASGYNRYTNSIDWESGWRTVTDVFGGITSFAVLFVLIVLIFMCVLMLARKNQNGAAAAVAVVVAVVAALVGSRWVRFPQGSAWLLVGLIVINVVFTIIILTIVARTAKKAVAP